MTIMTTIKVSRELRDRLFEVARVHYGDATLAETLNRLLQEHEEREVLAAFDRLRADPEEWESYRREAVLTDNAAGDWLGQDRSA